MKKLWGVLLVAYLLGVLSGWAVESYHSSQVLTDELEHSDVSCIREETSMHLQDLKFHTGTALKALEGGSTVEFNLSMVEVERDLFRLYNDLASSTRYLYPELPPAGEEIANLTDPSPCIEFVRSSREAVLKGESNIPAVEDGLSLINSFAVEWLGKKTYPSREFIEVHKRLQEGCELLVPKIKNARE